MLLAKIDRVRLGKAVRGSLDAGFMTRVPSELLLDQAVWRLWNDRLPRLTGYERLPGAIVHL